MESVKKSIDERAQHKREYDSWVNERQIQTTEGKVDTGKAVDASLVNTESIGTESKEQDTSSRSEWAHVKMQYPDPYMMKSNEHKVAKLLKENETLKKHYKDIVEFYQDNEKLRNIEHTTSLIANNDKFKAQLQEKGFAIAALKNKLRKLTGNSVNTKFAKSSILGKPALQPRRNQSVVRQPTAFKSERPSLSKQRFASQVDVNNDLSKPVTTHYLPKERESAVAKPHHMIAPGSSRYSSNDMVHNHYLEEAKKKTQESCRNSEPSVMPSARSQSTTNSSKPKPRINNQKSRNWPASKSSCVTTKTVPIAEHSRNSRSFSDSKHFMSSIKKTSIVHEKTMTPRSCLRWKPTGKLFKTVGLKWIPTGKIFTSSTTKVDSEPTNGSNDDITNQYECKQTLDVSAGLAPPRQMTSDHNSSELGIHDHNNELSSSKLVPKVVPQAEKTATSRQELELLFHHHITMLRTCGHETNLCRLDTTHHHPAAADTVVAEVGTADNIGHTMAEHTQVGCRLPAVEHYKPQPCARTLPDTCPSDMIADTPSALSPLGISPSYCHTNPA
ncbi:hypothetical protein Tco_0697482 [Tanacetum coccineum]